MRVHDVFTPDAYPEHTYVERKRGEYEDNLEFDLQGSAALISLSGPSKSGKTMLLNNAIDKLGYELVVVRGSEIDSLWSLWETTLDELGVPLSTSVTEQSREETEKEGNVGTNLPIVEAGASGTKRDTDSTEETLNRGRRGLKQIAESVKLDEFVLYIDDAHYIDESAHSQISEGLKDAYERGMKICVGFIPYRSDDLTRVNPDLSGRITTIDLEYWNFEDLVKIGEKGFDILNRYPSDLILKNLSRESVGSPHLMQKLCLEMCKELGVVESAEEMTPLDAKSEDLINVLQQTADNFYPGYLTVFEYLSGEVSKGDNSRNNYDFKLKGKGDIYDVILRAIAVNPPKLSLSRNEIISRVQEVCKEETPHSGNLVQTIRRMDDWISDNVPEQSYCFDWVEERKTLKIPDPYLIFCLRWSDVTDVDPGLH